jgi:hypothetical protein
VFTTQVFVTFDEIKSGELHEMQQGITPAFQFYLILKISIPVSQKNTLDLQYKENPVNVG